jgi:hypothetical protein
MAARANQSATSGIWQIIFAFSQEFLAKNIRKNYEHFRESQQMLTFP